MPEHNTPETDQANEQTTSRRLAVTAAELDQRNAELESSLNAFPDLRFTISADGTYLSCWAANPEVLFVPVDRLVGTNVADYFPAALTEEILNAITKTLTTSDVTSVEYRVDEGERTVYYEARLAPLAEDRVMVVVRDITDTKALEAQLIHAETMQSIGRLTAGVAHDFNNVLHVIRGHASALMRNRGGAEAAERRLAAIIRAVDRTSSLIDRLMKISRPTPNDPTPTVIDAFLRALAPSVEQLLGEAIQLDLSLGAGELAVVIDDSRLENVVLNLATNARDAMPHGGALHMTTRRSGNDTVLIEVADTGEGMDRETARHAFEPFFTTKALGMGSGLGLSSAYSTISTAGGSITVDSKPGSGTRFSILLPITTIDPAAVRANPPAPVTPKAGTILVVEDEAEVLELCADVLRELGYRTLEALSGSQALALIDQEHIDVVLTDVVMPGMNGIALAKAIYALRPDMPVILMSGYADDYSAEELENTTDGGILRKPFTDAELAAAVAARPSTGE